MDMVRARNPASKFPQTFLPALLISVALSVLCSGALYYLLARQDLAIVTTHNEALDRAADEKARAVTRTFAWFTEMLLGENLTDVQRAIDIHLREVGVLDAAVIAENNVIVAAKSPDAVGRRLQDSAWMSARTTQSEVVSRGIEVGRPAVVVVEPLRDRDHVVAWVRVVYALPQDYATVRSADDLAAQVAIYTLPLLLLSTLLLVLAMRGMLSQVRMAIAKVIMEAFESHKIDKAADSRMPRLG
ncbi:MAG: hypothetical protein U0231_18345 [Nitrospiraceae bacterium]